MKKILLGIIIAALLSVGVTYAQDVNFGTPAQQTVKIKIQENGDVHVTHVVDGNTATQHLEFLSDDFTNLAVADEKGGDAQYAQASAAKAGLVIFPTKDKVLVDYDIPAMVKQRSGLWTWDYLYEADTAFYLPESVKLFYVNNNFVDLGKQQGFMCHGCQVMLQYELTPTEITKQVTWEDKKFDVKMITLLDIKSLELDQENRKLKFDVTEPNKFVTMIIPKALLWNPYDVTIDGKKIIDQERSIDSENVLLHIKPNQTGTIEISGTSVVPEFPLAAILVLSAAMSVVIYTKKSSLR